MVGTYITQHFGEPFGDYISYDDVIPPASVQALMRRALGEM